MGVDWASLVAETRPRERSDTEAIPGGARKRWEPHRLLARIGVSLQYAGAEIYNQIQQQISEKSGKKLTYVCELYILLFPQCFIITAVSQIKHQYYQGHHNFYF